jgi:superfamily II DNA or RNA helicase
MPPFTHLEFHRSGIGLVPQGTGQSDTAIYVANVPGSSKPLRSCTCPASRTKTCDHLRDLSRALLEVQKIWTEGKWEAEFSASLWHRLARLLFEGNAQPSAKVRVLQVGESIRITSPSGEELARYLDGSEGQVRFLERTGKVAPGSGVFDRADLLQRLALFQATVQERALHKAGMKTQRQSWEESFWHRIAYHCERELEPGERGTFHPAVDEATGAFTLTWRRAGVPIVQVTVPRPRVRAALQLLGEAYPDQEDLAIRPIPLRSIFHAGQDTELDLVEVRPMIRALQQTGEERFLEMAEVEKYRYGSLIWLKDLGVLAELEREGKERRFKAPARLTLRRHQIPGFLEEHRNAVGDGVLVLDAPLRDRKIFKEFDRIEIGWFDLEEALERSWWWLAVEYGFGNQRVSLASILQARREGLPYLEVPGGWIDLNAPAFRDLEDLVERQQLTDDGEKAGRIRLSSSELLRLQAAAGVPVRVSEISDSPEGESTGLLDRLLELRPAAPFHRPQGLATEPRAYQKIGIEWLRFLWENRLAGLLCDDMGLGKTLQTAALLVGLHEEKAVTAPFLVACPTSVLPHWRDQIRKHAPGLRPLVHHGAQRRLPSKLSAGDVLITSYGVLRRDAEELSAVPFAVAVFDEVQQIKNRQTQAWQAAAHLVADIKLGLTGTPIENSLEDLKTLFDLILPGYLGTDAGFADRYLRLPEGRGREREEEQRLTELRRIISPFVLRRLKTSVLDELPEKIEDLRTCVLSDDQVGLYRDAIGGKGAELARQIEAAGDAPLPYIHVFALLNLLKQVCDHPALALGKLDEADRLASGKWDLYREILQEALDSGQKVVVFTQFLGMIELMERHLRELGVGHVTLTGATARRGEVVDRFNLDPECRVFLGSLKAGGTGIDLVGGSVVIHYDRWWNAAREDQATDRVYRIGQKRAVQVFKLVTEGTLEEKISAIIDRKRRMMASVVQEDDPKLAKIFSREELLEMLKGV